jgi:hypothetical protein
MTVARPICSTGEAAGAAGSGFVQVEQRLIGGIKRSDFVGSMSTALTAAKFPQ